MQRQADNRQFMIAEGFAFIARYRTLKGGDDELNDEVEYNLGRAYQQLGLRTYAVKHYERVLQIADARLEKGEKVDGRLSWSLRDIDE
jgi:general transcription factor 3C polypeptide 3 (transcription factor C subunit 4)